MKSKITIVLFVCLVLTLVGCYDSKDSKTNIDTISIQEEYLNEKSFNIISSNGISESYVLNKKKLGKNLDNIIWGLQKIDVKNYIGKNIDIYSYTVNNHKLDSYGDMKQTSVWVIICEGKIIGGYTFPQNSETLFGSVYSIDGDTLEEITDMDFQEWLKEWSKKYN